VYSIDGALGDEWVFGTLSVFGILTKRGPNRVFGWQTRYSDVFGRQIKYSDYLPR